MATMAELVEFYGEPISTYSRAQAIEDGALIDMAEWASPREMMGGFTCPVAMTAALWARVDVDSMKRKPMFQSTRGRAHDVLWMASIAGRRYRRTMEAGAPVPFVVKVGGRNLQVHLVLDGDGMTIGLPEDF